MYLLKESGDSLKIRHNFPSCLILVFSAIKFLPILDSQSYFPVDATIEMHLEAEQNFRERRLHIPAMTGIRRITYIIIYAGRF